MCISYLFSAVAAPQPISFIFVGEAPMPGPHCMIYKQTVCECLLQKRVCWNRLSQPGAVTKEMLPLCPLLCADHRQRCFTLSCWFWFGILPPPPFFSREGALCFIWQGKRKKESSPQSVHGQCCCKKTSFKLLLLRHPYEHTCTWNLPTVMPHRSLPSQVEGWHSVGLWRPVLRILKTPAHNLWQSVVIGA